MTTASGERMDEGLAYKVHLPLYEGPLDLLLHLIKKNDLDIYNIPIVEILGQYLDYLKLAKELDIDLAGEFLDMAAELTYIKSKMLLPEPPEEDEEEGPDPREELIARLLDYQRFKQAGAWLLGRPLLGRDVFAHPLEAVDPAEIEESLVEADTITLLSAFSDILKRLPQETVHRVETDRIGVTERVVVLMEFLERKGTVTFASLFEGVRDRSLLIVTFLAILEMAKQRLVRIIQDRAFQMIIVEPLITEVSGDGA